MMSGKGLLGQTASHRDTKGTHCLIRLSSPSRISSRSPRQSSLTSFLISSALMAWRLSSRCPLQKTATWVPQERSRLPSKSSSAILPSRELKSKGSLQPRQAWSQRFRAPEWLWSGVAFCAIPDQRSRLYRIQRVIFKESQYISQMYFILLKNIIDK